ncbi:MAG: urea ABC transporter substrate-binding protein, partial [Rhodospirillaceae bacterium]|nr:urea ABC transporter substrate-binding protein [Rhodospirillaceae bacterium]
MLLASVSAMPAWAEDPIKVGLLEDVSGDIAVMGLPKLHGSELAAKEINDAG